MMVSRIEGEKRKRERKKGNKLYKSGFKQMTNNK